MQEVLVYLIVGAAALVVARRYGPAPLRAMLSRLWPGRGSIAVNAKCGGCDGCAPSSDVAQATISVEALKKTIRAK